VDTTLYEEWLLAQGLDPSTVNIYRGKLVRASQVAGESGWDLKHMSASELGSLAGHFPNTSSSMTLLKYALIHYWQMCGVENPAKAIRTPKAPPYKYRGVEPDQAALLAATSRGWWPHGGVVLLGLYLALRREEMASLTWESFDESMEWVTIFGKGSKTRYLPVHDSLRVELEPRVNGGGYVFPGRQRDYVHTATVRTWVGTVAQEAGCGYLSPHQLRHTCLATMNDETGDLRITQYFAGHSDPAVTARYTRATERRLLAAVTALQYAA
jgi:integrase/recombinase XerD